MHSHSLRKERTVGCRSALFDPQSFASYASGSGRWNTDSSMVDISTMVALDNTKW